MVEQGLVGHVISAKGLEVEKMKIEVIKYLPYPSNVCEVRTSLGHVGFYRRFIKDFSKISQHLCNFLQKDVSFYFDEGCQLDFAMLKNKFISSPLNLLIGIILLRLCVMLVIGQLVES